MMLGTHIIAQLDLPSGISSKTLNSSNSPHRSEEDFYFLKLLIASGSE